MSKFRRFVPIEVRFLPFAHFPVDKNREEIRDFRIWEEGEKFRFLAKIFTLADFSYLYIRARSADAKKGRSAEC